jgi:hypothetical protein
MTCFARFDFFTYFLYLNCGGAYNAKEEKKERLELFNPSRDAKIIKTKVLI